MKPDHARLSNEAVFFVCSLQVQAAARRAVGDGVLSTDVLPQPIWIPFDVLVRMRGEA